MIPMVRQQALLVVVAILVFFTNLGSYAVFNNEEARNAASGSEMFRRGDWMVPTFNDESRTDESILVFWTMFASFKLFGVSEFSDRFASSIFAVGTTLLTYHLGRMLYSKEVGFLAGLILCTCLWFSAVGRSVAPDSMEVFFITLIFTSYVWVIAKQRGGHFSQSDESTSGNNESLKNVQKIPDATLEASPKDRFSYPLFPATWLFAAPIYVAIGLMVLAKGPLGLILPSASILLFLLMMLRDRDLNSGALTLSQGTLWRRGYFTALQIFRPRPIVEVLHGMHSLIGFGIVCAIALPWFLGVTVLTNGRWLHGFLFDHNIASMITAENGHNGFPLYLFYYVFILLVGCFPWSVFLPVALSQMQERFHDRDRGYDSDLLLACWAGLWFLLFSLASTRLGNCILPIYPAVALGLARYFSDWEKDRVDEGVYSFNLCCRAMMIIGALMFVIITISAYLWFSNDQWLAIAAAIPIAGGFAARKFLELEQRRRVMQCLIGTALLLAVLVVGIAPERIGHYQDSPAFLKKARELSAAEDVDIGTYGYFEPSVVYYARKKVLLLKTPREVADFLTGHPRGFVITPLSKQNELRDEVTDSFSEIMRHRNFLHREELILLGRK